MKLPLIFDIKRYAINDGPGIRTTIFFKGCPLSCSWCHNPESILAKAQKLYTADKCILCSTCTETCPNKAIRMEQRSIITNYELCTLCGVCAERCPTEAMEISGKEYSIEQLMLMFENEVEFYDHSKGGVTFSGGEPLLHYPFLIELLKACGDKEIHRVVDTSGYAKEEVLMRVAQYTDLFLFDLKIMDNEKHKYYTGVENKLILSNLKILAETGAEINIRIPFIEGITADAENIEKTAVFVASLTSKLTKVNLLPYHNIAKMKYKKLDKTYHHNILEKPDTEQLHRAIAIFEQYGIEAVEGG